MPTPFPGMDPYLERPGLWDEVHTALITGIRQFLTPLLRPHYRVAIAQRIYLSMPKSVAQASVMTTVAMVTPVIADPPVVGELPQPEEVVERYLEIRDTTTQEVVTAIEILSPTNKETQDVRRQYEQKRLNLLASATNLVEIDLLRGGAPFAMSIAGQTGTPQNHYRIVISRSWQRPRADLYLFNLQQPIPSFLIPLRPGEQEPVLPLNQILHTLYDQSGYDLAIDYTEPVSPPLAAQEAAWVTQLLKR